MVLSLLLASTFLSIAHPQSIIRDRPQDSQLQRGPPEYTPLSQITIGQCSRQAFEIVKSIAALNQDAIVSLNGERVRELIFNEPKAYVAYLPDKTESWDIQIEYTLKTPKGVVVGRQVSYQVILRPFVNNFCEILDVKKTSKRDFFIQVK